MWLCGALLCEMGIDAFIEVAPFDVVVPLVGGTDM